MQRNLSILWCTMISYLLDVEHDEFTDTGFPFESNVEELILDWKWNDRYTITACRDFGKTFCVPITRHSTSALSSAISSTWSTVKIQPDIGTGNEPSTPAPIWLFSKKKNRPTYVKLFIWMKNGCPTLAFIQDVLLLIDSSVKNKFIVPNFSEGMII